jgi:pilus assembly protein Flp/PilA
MKQILKNLAIEDAGQDLIEYAMVAAIIALGSLAVLRSASTNIGKVFNGIGTALTTEV